MPLKWKDVVNSDQYQKLENTDKWRAKATYAKKYIVSRPDFQKLGDKDKFRVLERFGREKDLIDRGWVSSVLRKADQKLRELPLSGAQKAAVETIAGGFGTWGKAMEFSERFVENQAQKVATLGGKLPARGVPPGRTLPGLFIKDGGRFLAASLMRFAKPSEIA